MVDEETPNVVYLGSIPIYKSQGETYKQALLMQEVQKEFEKEIAKNPNTPYSAEARAVQTVEKKRTQSQAEVDSSAQNQNQNKNKNQTYQVTIPVEGALTPSGPMSMVVTKTIEAPNEKEALKQAEAYKEKLIKGEIIIDNNGRNQIQNQTYQFSFSVEGLQTPSGPVSTVVTKTIEAPNEEEARKQAESYKEQLIKENTITNTILVPSPLSSQDVVWFASKYAKTPLDAIQYANLAALAGSLEYQSMIGSSPELSGLLAPMPKIQNVEKYNLTNQEKVAIIQEAIERRKQYEEGYILTGFKKFFYDFSADIKRYELDLEASGKKPDFITKTATLLARELINTVPGTIELIELPTNPNLEYEWWVPYTRKTSSGEEITDYYTVYFPPSYAATLKQKEFLETRDLARTTWEELLTPEGVLAFGLSIATLSGLMKAPRVVREALTVVSPFESEVVGKVTSLTELGYVSSTGSSRISKLTVEGLRSQGGEISNFISDTYLIPLKKEGYSFAVSRSRTIIPNPTDLEPLYGVEPITYQSYRYSKEPVFSIIRNNQLEKETMEWHLFTQEGTKQSVISMNPSSTLNNVFAAGDKEITSIFGTRSGSLIGTSRSIYSDTEHFVLGQSLYKQEGLLTPIYTKENFLVKDLPVNRNDLLKLISKSLSPGTDSVPYFSGFRADLFLFEIQDVNYIPHVGTELSPTFPSGLSTSNVFENPKSDILVNPSDYPLSPTEFTIPKSYLPETSPGQVKAQTSSLTEPINIDPTFTIKSGQAQSSLLTETTTAEKTVTSKSGQAQTSLLTETITAEPKFSFDSIPAFNILRTREKIGLTETVAIEPTVKLDLVSTEAIQTSKISIIEPTITFEPLKSSESESLKEKKDIVNPILDNGVSTITIVEPKLIPLLATIVNEKSDVGTTQKQTFEIVPDVTYRLITGFDLPPGPGPQITITLTPPPPPILPPLVPPFTPPSLPAIEPPPIPPLPSSFIDFGARGSIRKSNSGQKWKDLLSIQKASAKIGNITGITYKPPKGFGKIPELKYKPSKGSNDFGVFSIPKGNLMGGMFDTKKKGKSIFKGLF